MAFSLSIDGTDVTKYIAYQGVKWTREDVDGPNAGRTLDGTMIRDRVATKIRMDITCRPLRAEELSILLNALLPEYISVNYADPMYGMRTVTMYANNNPASYRHCFINGVEYWDSVTFPLVEV